MAANNSLRRAGIFIVGLHLLVSLVHGAAHSQLHIEMNYWQSTYVLLVITLLPLVSALLIWRRWRGGFPVLAISMLGSFGFGVYFHFIAVGADNVASLGSQAAALPFQLTAVLLSLTELAGAAIGFFGGAEANRV